MNAFPEMNRCLDTSKNDKIYKFSDHYATVLIQNMVKIKLARIRLKNAREELEDQLAKLNGGERKALQKMTSLEIKAEIRKHKRGKRGKSKSKTRKRARG